MSDAIRGVLIDSLGRPINGALVKIYNAGTASFSSIYSDEALTVPVTNDGITSPLSEADGSYGPYYAANGRYDIKPAKSGYTFDNTDLADINIEDVRTEPMTITAAHTFTAAVVHQGVETHSGNESFTGQPGFNPGVAQAPFTLNANARDQRVVGFAADKVWDGTAFNVERAVPDQSGLTSGVATKVQYSTEVFDPGNAFDSVTNYRYTAPVAGRYLFGGAVSVSAATGNLTSIKVELRSSGMAFRTMVLHGTLAIAAGVITSYPFSEFVSLGVGDYLEVFVTVTTSAGTWSILSHNGQNQPAVFYGVRLA